MKHNTTVKRTHLVGYALLLLQTILLITTSFSFLANRYENQWQDYLNNQTIYNIYLNRIPNNKKENVISFLETEAENQHFLLLKKENIDNNFALGIDGDLSKINASFIFDGRQVITKKDLSKLIYSNNENATLGLGKGSINQITSIYKFPLSNQVVIYKLNQFNKINKTINGKYQLVGLNSEKSYNSIIKKLSKITSLEEDTFKSPSSGASEDNGLLYSFLIFGLLVTSLGLFGFFFINLLSSFKEFGTLILLGWSKKTILFNRYKKFMLSDLYTGLFFLAVLTIIFGRNSFFVSFVIYSIFAIFLGLVLFTIIFIVASFVVIFSKNISLIKAKYPKKIIYTFIIGLYVLISSSLLGIAIYIDGPTKEIAANAQQALQWQKVENMEVLKKIDSGDDGVRSLSDSSSQIYKDIWNFYHDIANEKGVYLISSFYGSHEWLSDRYLYKSMPTRPFTILTASPNYLDRIDFPINRVALKQAQQGKRVFYVPDTYSSTQRSKLKIFLKDMLTEDISKSDVQTTFTKKQQVSLFTYHNNKDIFLWNNNVDEPTHDKMPIISIVTPENMTFVDIGNIQVAGLESNLKFENKDIAKKILTHKRLAKYHLDDNKLEYTAIYNYIDGEQKTLWQTITMFSILLIALLLILCLLIIVLAMTFKTNNKQRIAVKKFLGFTFWQIYRLPLLIISIITFIELVIIFMVRSHIGIPLILFNYLVQILVFYFYISNTQFTQIIDLLKGE